MSPLPSPQGHRIHQYCDDIDIDDIEFLFDVDSSEMNGLGFSEDECKWNTAGYQDSECNGGSPFSNEDSESSGSCFFNNDYKDVDTWFSVPLEATGDAVQPPCATPLQSYSNGQYNDVALDEYYAPVEATANPVQPPLETPLPYYSDELYNYGALDESCAPVEATVDAVQPPHTTPLQHYSDEQYNLYVAPDKYHSTPELMTTHHPAPMMEFDNVALPSTFPQPPPPAPEFLPAATLPPAPNCGRRPQRKPVHRWTKEEHVQFLIGLEKYKKRDWISISRCYLSTKSPTQIASHAQKYFIRQQKNVNVDAVEKKRRSIHDITIDQVLRPKGT